MNEPSPLKLLTAELIGFGVVGTILFSAHETLLEIDHTMARDLEVIMDRAMNRFRAAEEALFEMDGFKESISKTDGYNE